MLNNGLFFKKVYKVIKFNQNSCARAYIDVNADLRKKAKNDFQKDFSLSWWIMQRLEKLWKMWENIEMSNSSQQIEEGID